MKLKIIIISAVLLISFSGCCECQKMRQSANPDFVNVKIETNMGNIFVELNKKAAPITVDNFLRYTSEGAYDGTIFHRVINDFMIQGGGHNPDLSLRPTHPPIKNEADNGLLHDRGTITMARSEDLDSATNQFTISHADNPHLNPDGRYPWYTVFGKVTKGMEVVDAIAAVETSSQKDPDGHTFNDVPVEPVVIKSITVIY